MTTIKVVNPNCLTFPITDLDIAYNEDSSYVSGSLSSTVGGLGIVDVSESGNILAEGFTISSGTSSIMFKIKAPIKSALAYLKEINGNEILDGAGKAIVESLDISVDFEIESDDVCSETAISTLSISFEIPYCVSKECIVRNKNITSRLKK